MFVKYLYVLFTYTCVHMYMYVVCICAYLYLYICTLCIYVCQYIHKCIYILSCYVATAPLGGGCAMTPLGTGAAGMAWVRRLQTQWSLWAIWAGANQLLAAHTLVRSCVCRPRVLCPGTCVCVDSAPSACARVDPECLWRAIFCLHCVWIPHRSPKTIVARPF